MTERVTSASKVAVFLAAVVSMAILAGCSASNSDVLQQGPQATADRVSALLESGNGSQLCDLENKAAPGSCDSLMDSSGLGSKPVIQVEVSPFDSNNIKYTFSDPRISDKRIPNQQTSWKLTLEAKPMTTEQGKSWIYQFAWSSIPSLSLPFGGSIGDTKIKAQTSYAFMPGPLKARIQPAQDANGWFNTTLDEKTRVVDAELTKTGASKVEALAKEECARQAGKFKPDFGNFYIQNRYGAVKMQPLSTLKLTLPCKVERVEADQYRVAVTTTFKVVFSGKEEDSFWIKGVKATYTANHEVYVVWALGDNGRWPTRPEVAVLAMAWKEN